MARALRGRRGILLLGVVVLVLATACEEASQKGARKVVQARLRALPNASDYDISNVHCTRTARIGYISAVRTKRYFCMARLAGSADCDLFRVDARQGIPPDVTRVRESAACELPAG